MRHFSKKCGLDDVKTQKAARPLPGFCIFFGESPGRLEVCVQRPQHDANASRIYQSLQQVKATLLNFGIAEQILP